MSAAKPRTARERTLRAGAVGSSCALFATRRAGRVLTQHYEEALRSTGVGAAQFTLMMVLDGFRSLAVGELAQHLVADVTTVSRNVGVLERRGFVRRTAGDDGRVRRVEITRAGRDALDRAHAGWQSVQDRLARALGPDRLRHLISELDAAAAALGDD